LTWARTAHLPAFNAVVGLTPHGRLSATGTWQGWPSSHLLGSLMRHVVAPTPSCGKGRSGPPRPVQIDRPQRGLAPTRGGAGPPSGSGPMEAIPEHPVLVGTWWHRTYMSTGGRSGDHDPSCQAQAVCPVTQRTKVRTRIALRPSGWRPCQTAY
jgi:hypothetical protein